MDNFKPTAWIYKYTPSPAFTLSVRKNDNQTWQIIETIVEGPEKGAYRVYADIQRSETDKFTGVVLNAFLVETLRTLYIGCQKEGLPHMLAPAKEITFNEDKIEIWCRPDSGSLNIMLAIDRAIKPNEQQYFEFFCQLPVLPNYLVKQAAVSESNGKITPNKEYKKVLLTHLSTLFPDVSLKTEKDSSGRVNLRFYTAVIGTPEDKEAKSPMEVHMAIIETIRPQVLLQAEEKYNLMVQGLPQK